MFTFALAVVVLSNVATESVDASTPKAVNLVANTQVRSAVVVAYEQFRHIPAQEVAGLYPGALWYAYVPSTHQYWAIATVMLSPHAGPKYQVEMQEGTDNALLTRRGTARWTVVDILSEPTCYRYTHSVLPEAVRALWGYCDSW